MAILKWRPQALKDLDSVEAFLEELSPDYARFFVGSAFEKTRQLERFPRSGRIVPEIGIPAVRELIYRNYRVIYLVGEGEQEVEVLTVLHSSRQFGGLSETPE